MLNTVAQLRTEIATLEAVLAKKRAELELLESQTTQHLPSAAPSVHNASTPQEKIQLFHSLFRGREDVYARRFESAKTGKVGYQPVCANEWLQGVCDKPRIKCGDCKAREFLPYTKQVIECHLLGEDASGRSFVVGVYPMLVDETCWFLAVDFDKVNWTQDALAFLETCNISGVPASLERSRSGNGGHVWIFFADRIPARTARNLGAALMTKTLDRRPEIGLDSFDRFFPNQDTMPKGGLGNLIALPLQKKAREKNHSLFLDELLQPYADQWAYLASIQKMGREAVERMVQGAQMRHEVLPVAHGEPTDDSDAEPWKIKPEARFPVIQSALPQKIDVVLSNQIFIDSSGLPAVLRNRILRLASFSNPEFYQAQAMRLPTWGKARILYLYEQFPRHIAIPIGCLDALQELLEHYKIQSVTKDERNPGTKLDVAFAGTLYPEQLAAATALAAHPNGILSATTAFGKTVVALWLIAERKVNTLILVHRTQLLDQWVERISQFLGVPKKSIGRIGGGRKKRIGTIDVALIQSVSRQGKVEDWVKEYGQVIVDECHHISAFSFEQSIRSSSALYKVGLSATLTRKDGQHPIVLMNLGPIRYVVSAKKQAAERSFEHWVKVRPTQLSLSADHSSMDIQDVFQKVWSNEARNQQILNDVLTAVEAHRQILVLSERTEHLEWFRQALENRVKSMFVLKGGMGKKQTKAIMAALAATDKCKSVVILATGRYLGEGFDLPNLDTLFLTFPVSWRGTLAQYAGRLHREFAGKTEVIVYDYMDQNVSVLSRMHAKRLKGYAALGYKVLQA